MVQAGMVQEHTVESACILKRKLMRCTGRLTMCVMEEIVRAGTWTVGLNRRVERYYCGGVCWAWDQQSRIPCWTRLIWNAE